MGATLVTGAGEVLNARDDENADILWALRGGQPGLGVVTEVELRLADIPALYAGVVVLRRAAHRGRVPRLDRLDRDRRSGRDDQHRGG